MSGSQIRTKMILNLSLILCLIAHVSLADPQINEKERKNEKYNASSAVIKMTSRIPLNGTVSWKYFSYLHKYPQSFDVTFAVGPEKMIVKALKIALISSSPVFERDFEERWNQTVMDEENEIPLKDLDPVAFKLFVELTILNTWSVEALMALELHSNQLLHLMSICYKYRMQSALNNLTELAKDFVRDFGTHVKPEDFLQLSQVQLETILAGDDLKMNETEVFNYACRWATEQCKKRNLEPTGKNKRLVLGNCVYQIRFPTMSSSEFARVTKQEGLLSFEEAVQIFQFIALNQNDSKSNDLKELQFKTEKRSEYPFTPAGSMKLSVAQIFPITDTPVACVGTEINNRFNMNIKISLRGFGFLGPINSNSFYNVTVQILRNGRKDVTEKMKKRIFAQKSKTFYFIFDQPIVLDPIPYDGWSTYYLFDFYLEGPNTRSLKYDHEVTKRIYDGNKEFAVYWRSAHLLEIVYDVL